MRILLLIRNMGFGGAENHVLALATELHKHGHEVLLACPENAWTSVRFRERGLETRHLAMRGLDDLFSYWKLRRLVRTWRPDIVHAHGVRPSQYASLALIGTGVPTISTAHSTGARKHMRRINHIIAVSDAVLQNLIQNGYAPEHLTRIYNGVPDVPPGDKAALRRELGIPDQQFALVCAARFNPQKGQEMLVEAVKRMPEYIHVYLMGDTGTDYGKRVVAAANGFPRIHFCGYRDDVSRLLPAFDAAVSPSYTEAFSLSLAEAAAARLPVVATAVGGVPEVVIDGETGLLVPPNQPEAFADAVVKLASVPALSAELSRRSRERYEREFTVEKMTSSTTIIYQKIISLFFHLKALSDFKTYYS
jgi:glycosyltransferase involved in cell wall biosynthesis